MCAGIRGEIGSTSVNRNQPLSCMRQALLGADHPRAGGCTRAKPARNDNLEPGFRFGGGPAEQRTAFRVGRVRVAPRHTSCRYRQLTMATHTPDLSPRAPDSSPFRVWVTTDSHFFHTALSQEFGRPVDFQDRLVRAWRRSVAASDLVIHLGHVVVGSRKDEVDAHELIASLPGRKWLTLGNHDKRGFGWYMRHGWDALATAYMLELFGERILLSHEPRAWDGWFTVNIHGHFHDTDHRLHEPQYLGVLDERHRLLALEHVGYAPVLLKTFVEAHRRGGFRGGSRGGHPAC